MEFLVLCSYTHAGVTEGVRLIWGNSVAGTQPGAAENGIMRHVRLLLITLALMATAAASAQPGGDTNVVVIGHAGGDVERLPRHTVRALFAMRQRAWPDGQAARVFVLPNDDPVHARFAKKQLEVFPHQLQLSWDRLVFSGTGRAPGRVDSQQEMLEQVATTPGSLGYVQRDHVDDRVRVVMLD